jgi:hypothetical protein
MRTRHPSKEEAFRFLDQTLLEEEEAAIEQAGVFYTYHADQVPDLEPRPASAATAAQVRRAIGAAKRGDIEQLADLIRPVWSGRFPLSERAINPSIGRLSLEAWQLLYEYATGLRTRKKRTRGRPKLSADERRAATPVHDAARFALQVEKILRSKFPREPVREWAIEYAARRCEIEIETLGNYLARPRSDRRRI